MVGIQLQIAANDSALALNAHVQALITLAAGAVHHRPVHSHNHLRITGCPADQRAQLLIVVGVLGRRRRFPQVVPTLVGDLVIFGALLRLETAAVERIWYGAGLDVTYVVFPV